MSGEKASNPCGKFQANIFNKSKCQNCFKSRELHPLTDQDLEQAKPIYGGWLCLAPEGTDFENPMQRSRKWQRRFFILYEHGSLSFALDELPSTLPQGTVNMNLCTDIADAEPRTGQRNALCIATAEQEIFIRGDNKEIISGWSEQLTAYLRTNKQSQKKKRKVQPAANQEPSPAKISATSPSFPILDGDSNQGEEQQREGGPDVTVTDSGTEETPTGNPSSYLWPLCGESPTSDSPLDPTDDRRSIKDQQSESNNVQKSNNQSQTLHKSGGSSAERLLGSEATTWNDQGGKITGSRKGRSEARTNTREKLQSCGDITQLGVAPPPRRSKSLDRRTSDTVMTPDLLNFKKGWMVKLDENDQWKKYWFVLSTDSLRYYKDSVAEEASDLEGEIDLTKCYSVSEYQVQRNYGFQIHTPKDIFTLSAMTAGIRKNWIQALMKNVHPANAPDITSLPGHHLSSRPPEVLPKPDVTQDSSSVLLSSDREPRPRPRSVTEKRKEGRYKTFDWAEFRPQSEPTSPADPPRTRSPCSLELIDVERRKRREERRRRYENMLGFPLRWEEVGGRRVESGIRALSPKSQQKVEEDMEDCWRQVEKIMYRPDKTVKLFNDPRDAVETEKMLHSYRQNVEDLKVQLAQSECGRLKLEAQLSAAGVYQQQLDSPLCPDFYPSYTNKSPLNDESQSVKETRDLVIEEPLQSQLPSIWLQDTEGNIEELQDLLSETPLLSPDLQHQPADSDLLNGDASTLDLRDPLFSTSETQTNNCDFSRLILDTPVEEDDNHKTAVLRLSEEVELLTSQNEALNQRNQEMLNQLTEADREIERLKAELSCRYSEPRHLPEAEQQGKTRAEELERELNLRNQELLEAQTLLRETEAMLQLSDSPEEREENPEKAEGYFLRCFEATEAKLTELERKLRQSEVSREELQQQNIQLKEEEEIQRRRATEAEADVQRLREELEKREELKTEKVKEELEEKIREELVEKVREELEEKVREELEEKVREDLEGNVREELEEKIRENLEVNVREELEEKIRKDLEENVREEVEEKFREELEKSVRETIENQVKEELSKIVREELEENVRKELEEKVREEEGLEEIKEEILKEELEEERSGEEKMQQVMEGMVGRLRAVRSLFEAMEGLDLATESVEEEESPTVIEQLKQEERFWGLLLTKLKDDRADVPVVEASELMISESQFLLKAYETLLHAEQQSNCSEDLKDFKELIRRSEIVTTPENISSVFGFEKERVKSMTEIKISLLSQVSPTQLHMNIDRLHGFYCPQLPSSVLFLHSVATETLHYRRLMQLQSRPCCSCGRLTRENTELKERLTKLEEQRVTSADASSQTLELLSAEESRNNEKEGVGNEPEMNRTESQQILEGIGDPNKVVCEQRGKVAELEEQISIVTNQLNKEFEEKISSMRMEHEKELEKLKSTCERGFFSMEESHLKVLEELQRRHQQEVQRLLVDRDRLLEEESAATAIAIEAIKNAHRVELQREVEKRCQSENSNGNTLLEEVYRQHSDELASYQRELEVLSQQFSLKCLENGHLVQALDAERKALCQCQQENQDLRTRNQELSGHLAAEITRLCSLAKQDALPLSQGMDVYEMEITLRVKESEVQCLKQEITSLKEELQAAVKDKRNATKKYKDMYTELSIVRAKADRDVDELRENLRLAHEALGQNSP